MREKTNMKILLIGEFSGVHNNLKHGLERLGHKVTLLADGDGSRGFKSDFKITPFKGKVKGKILSYFYVFSNIRKFIGYDIIQFIHPSHIPYYYFAIRSILLRLNQRSVYYVCGTDIAYMRSKDRFEYFPYDKSIKEEYRTYNLFDRIYYNIFINKIDVIIPSMYTYYIGYSANKKTNLPIPLPDSGIISEDLSKTKSKIKILYGISRRGFKGAEYILTALKRIKENYNDQVDVKIVERLSYTEYLKVLDNADILIDQCKSYDYAMNAINAMERGKIVLSGSEDVAMKYLNIQNSAVINILPDTNQIENEIIKLINMSPDQLLELKKQSYRQVKDIHDNNKIAKRFEANYLKLLSNY